MEGSELDVLGPVDYPTPPSRVQSLARACRVVVVQSGDLPTPGPAVQACAAQRDHPVWTMTEQP